MTEMPVDPTASLRSQNIEILRFGHEQGWFRYEGLATRERRRDHDRFTVVTGDGTRLVLVDGEVRPWVLGVASAQGLARRALYREGLVVDQ